jgi:hypothetical protein
MLVVIGLLFSWFIPHAVLPHDMVLEDVQYARKAPGHPTYAETVMDVIYPYGSGPVPLGYPAVGHPVVVMLRGGNSNKPLEAGPRVGSPDVMEFRSRGYVVVDLSFHVIEKFVEPLEAATPDVARAIQYLRAYSPGLNTDPRRIIVCGRSMGALHGLRVALTEDFQQPPGAVDPVATFSSRPDAAFESSGITDTACFAPGSVMLQFLVPGHVPGSLTVEQHERNSATSWLAHPEEYGRDRTPYLGVGAFLARRNGCGNILDPHDGTFGVVFQDAIHSFAATGQAPGLLDAFALVDVSLLTPEQLAEAVADWADALPLHH